MSIPKDIKADAYYAVTVRKTVTQPGDVVLRPGQKITILGSLLKVIKADVETAVEKANG